MRLFTAAALLACLTACAHRLSPPAEELLVISRTALELHRVDASAGTVTATLATGNAPHEVAVSRDGRFAYLPIFGDGILGQPGTDGREIEVIDLATTRRVRTIDLGQGVRPHAIVVAPDGLLWVTAEVAQAVFVVDPQAGTVLARIPTGQPQSHNLALSPDGQRAYTSNVSTGTISVIHVPARRLIGTIPVASRIQRVSVSADSRWVFTHDTGAPRLAVIDAATNRIARWVPLPRPGYASAATPDGRRLLVAAPTRQTDAAGQSLSRLFIVDLRSWSVTGEVDAGCAPVDLRVSRDSRRAYLSCANGLVAVVDLRTLQPIRSIPIRPGLDGIEIIPPRT